MKTTISDGMYPNNAGTDYKYGSIIIGLLKILDGTGSLDTRRTKKYLRSR